MKVLLQLLLLVCSCVFSSQKIADKIDVKAGLDEFDEDAKNEEFKLTVADRHVKGVVDVPFNFTVMIENVDWRSNQIEVIRYGW